MASPNTTIPTSHRAAQAMDRNTPALQEAFRNQQLRWGAPIYIRIFKEEAELELWVEKDSEFVLFRTYPICTFSGDPGPKLRAGDLQSPEGFYFITPKSLNPASRFHLSFNIGYPNRYDRFHGRTGSALMVHGDCVSIGCYAMTDPQIEEIYTLVHSAFAHGQGFIRVHIFPFHMSHSRLLAEIDHRWYLFWRNLKDGYVFFEQHRRPPNVKVSREGKYLFNREHH